MTFPSHLIRQELLTLEPYDAERDSASVILDANESPVAPFGAVAKLCPVNRYAEPQPIDLRKRMGVLYGVSAEKILVTRGGDEGIDQLVRLFCRAGVDNILICPPTFVMYETYAAVQGVDVIRVPLKADDWQLDVPAILKACTDQTKLIFFPHPQAPMGHMMKREDILTLASARAGKTMIVCDEAYMEFTETEGLVQDLAAYPNLIIIRTLSKAYALAGERVGAVIGAPELIQNLRRIIACFPLSQSAIRAAMDTLSTQGVIEAQARIRFLVAEGQRLARLLMLSPFVKKVFPSVTNFLLVEMADGAAAVAQLARFGIRVRNRHKDIANTVRITLGLQEENDAVLVALGVTPEHREGKPARLYSMQRVTKETKINVTVNLDEPGFLNVSTGIGFFDHMVSQIAQHGGFGLDLKAEGDWHVDQHHVIEDCALALGDAIKEALGDKRGVARYGFTTPLDEALASVVIDLSARPFLAFEGTFPIEKAGEMQTDMAEHFFRSFATSLGATMHMKVSGANAHHMMEACFKALGRALRQAIRREGNEMPSTKGVL